MLSLIGGALAGGAGFSPAHPADLSRLANLYTSPKTKYCRVGYMDVGGRRIRQLVATQPLKAGTFVACYPVEIRYDDEINDFEYAIRIYRRHDLAERQTVWGVPTARSIREGPCADLPPIAMFSNEPAPGQSANATFEFPHDQGTQSPHELVGRIVNGYLKTTRPVRKGDAIVWCYGDGYERSYPTPCAT